MKSPPQGGDFVLCRHAAAGRCTPPAGGRAFLAMLILVLAAGFGTGFAGPGTQAAGLGRQRGAQAHQPCRGFAGGGAFHIEADALGHHLYVLLFRAGCRTMMANGRALQAGIDAFFISMVSFHISLFATTSILAPKPVAEIDCAMKSRLPGVLVQVLKSF